MRKVELERALRLAANLYYQLCRESEYPVSRKIAYQRMRALVLSREPI